MTNYIRGCHADQVDKVIGLFYDAELKVFVDEGGFVVWRIFDVITPNDLLLFRHYQDYMLVRHRSSPDVLVELFWPTDDVPWID